MPSLDWTIVYHKLTTVTKPHAKVSTASAILLAERVTLRILTAFDARQPASIWDLGFLRGLSKAGFA